MTATVEQINTAAAAVTAGMEQAEQHWTAASQAPGRGLPVALPSVPDSQGRRPQGLGFDLPDDVPALRKPERPRLVSDYGAAPAVGGMLHHAAQPGSSSGLDRVAWPTGPAQPSSVASRTNSVMYVPGHAVNHGWRTRLREAWSALLGR
jgi:hypothetical protein